MAPQVVPFMVPVPMPHGGSEAAMHGLARYGNKHTHKRNHQRSYKKVIKRI